MARAYLSHPRAITPISDPIHGRFEFNVFEREFVDSSFFQRLHFILQNSVAFSAFPANKNTRFPHSLGVAHIAGRLFTNAMKNAETPVLTDFLSDAAEFLERLIVKISPTRGVKPLKLDEIYEKLNDAHLRTISGRSGFFHSPLMMNESPGSKNRVHTEDLFGAKNQFTAIFVIEVYWQAIRMYGLMHDVGHLPMSHAFEHAFESYGPSVAPFNMNGCTSSLFLGLLNDRKSQFTSSLDTADNDDASSGATEERKSEYVRFFADLLNCPEESIASLAFDKDFHEVRGLSFFNAFISTYEPTFSSRNGNDEGDGFNALADLIHYLTLAISLASATTDSAASAEFSFLRSIRTIIDGDFDADRMDYTIRDGHESGSDIGKFDLKLVLENAILLKTQVAAGAPSGHAIGFHTQALSGIEQFYEQRFQSYKYIIYHRTASRANSCLERLIVQLFHLAFLDRTGKLANILEIFGYINVSDGSVSALLPEYDEHSFMVDDANLRTLILQIYREILKGVVPSAGSIAAVNSKEFNWVLREVENLTRVVVFRDYGHVANPFKRVTLVAHIEAQAKDAGMQWSRGQSFQFARHLVRTAPDRIRELQAHFLERRLNGGEPVAVLFAGLKPKIFDWKDNLTKDVEEQLLVVGQDSSIRHIGRASSSLKAMQARRRPEYQSRLYIVSKDIKNNATKYDTILQEINDILKQWMLNYDS